MQLVQAAYVSRARGARPLHDVAEIIGVSVRNNRAKELTGALLFADGLFVQVLEGDAGRVRSLLARLETDARHVDMRIVGLRSVRARSFPNWAMQHVGLGDRGWSGGAVAYHLNHDEIVGLLTEAAAGASITT